MAIVPKTNIDVLPSAFDTTYTDHLQQKINRKPAFTAADAGTRAVKSWAELQDGVLRTAQQRLTGTAVNAAEHGADPAAGDNTPALQAAIDAAEATSRLVYIGPGTYILLGEIDQKNVRIFGAGKGKTILTADTASSGNFSTEDAVLYSAGAIVALPNLSVGAGPTDATLTFVSAPSVVAGDIIVLWDPTDFSFGQISAEHRAGEMVTVASVSGSVVTIIGNLHDTYTTGINTYRLDSKTPGLSDITVIGLADTIVAPVRYSFCSKVTISGTEARQSRQSCISLENSYDCIVENCTVFDSESTLSGLNYGVCVSNCQSVRVSNCHGSTRRHVYTTGGNNGAGSVVNRHIRYSGCTGQSLDIIAFDFHGNSEHYSLSGCAGNGLNLGGNYGVVTNCNLTGDPDGGVALQTPGIIGWNFSITGCQFRAARAQDATRGLVDIVMSPAVTNPRGSMTISDCVSDVSDGDGHAFTFRHLSPAAQFGTVSVSGCSFIGGATVNKRVSFSASDATQLESLIFSNNAITLLSTQMLTGVARRIVAANNTVSAADSTAINIERTASDGETAYLVQVSNNTIAGAQLYGIRVFGTDASDDGMVYVSGNVVRDTGKDGAAPSAAACIGIQNVGSAVVVDNMIDDPNNAANILFFDGIDKLVQHNNMQPHGTLPVLRTATALEFEPSADGKLGARSAAGTPVGALTPLYLGENYFSTVFKMWFRSTGLTSADWVPLASLTTLTSPDVALSASATPSVLGVSHVSTTGTTTITDFTNVIDGQVIYVRATDNITIAHGANITLTGAADAVLANDDMMSFIQSDGDWREIGRSIAAATAGDASTDIGSSTSGAIAYFSDTSGKLLTQTTAVQHAQIVIKNGTRAFTGTVVGVAPTLSTHLSTRGYVDDPGITVHTGGSSDFNMTQVRVASIDGNATNITDFSSGGSAGHTLVILALGNRTIEHSSNIQLDGERDFPMENGDTLSLLHDGTNWIETARTRRNYFTTLSADQATYSVEGLSNITLANAATNVTDFTNGTESQELKIIATGNRTVVHGSPIALAGSVNFAMVSGSTLSLMHNGAKWFEMSRRAP